MVLKSQTVIKKLFKKQKPWELGIKTNFKSNRLPPPLNMKMELFRILWKSIAFWKAASPPKSKVIDGDFNVIIEINMIWLLLANH